MKGLLLVITGLSGSGKDTITDLILAEKSLNFKRIITHNSRPRRDEEREGYDYHFVAEEKFKELIASGEMIEYVTHGSFLKGTTRGEFQRILAGENLIWRIDPSRAAMAEEFFIEKFGKVGHKINSKTIKVFISVKNTTVLLERYKSREKGKSDILEFEKRLKQDLQAFKIHKHKFPHIIENDEKPGKAAQKILALIKKRLYSESR